MYDPINTIIANIIAKTMFSTHYHELTKMEKMFSGIKNVHVSISENDGDITFLHKVMDGPVDKSYGINVAKLAGLPKEVINKSNELLNMYERDPEKALYTLKELCKLQNCNYFKELEDRKIYLGENTENFIKKLSKNIDNSFNIKSNH